MRWNAVIFDRDGTLFDSLDVILQAFNYGIEPYTDRRPTDAEWFESFGPSEPDVLGSFVGVEHKRAAFNRFYDYYCEHIQDAPLFPGIRKLLGRLHADRVKLGIFTGGGYDSTVFCLQEQKILSFFEVLVTGDRVEKPKPEPEGVIHAMRVLGVEPVATLVVGDAGADMLAAKRAGAAAGLARWARMAPTFDLPSSPDVVFTAVSDLERFLYQE